MPFRLHITPGNSAQTFIPADSFEIIGDSIWGSVAKLSPQSLTFLVSEGTAYERLIPFSLSDETIVTHDLRVGDRAIIGYDSANNAHLVMPLSLSDLPPKPAPAGSYIGITLSTAPYDPERLGPLPQGITAADVIHAWCNDSDFRFILPEGAPSRDALYDAGGIRFVLSAPPSPGQFIYPLSVEIVGTSHSVKVLDINGDTLTLFLYETETFQTVTLMAIDAAQTREGAQRPFARSLSHGQKAPSKHCSRSFGRPRRIRAAFVN